MKKKIYRREIADTSFLVRYRAMSSIVFAFTGITSYHTRWDSESIVTTDFNLISLINNKFCRHIHMMRFTVFPEIRLHPGMKDIRDCRGHPQSMSLDISLVLPKPSIFLNLLYFSCLDLIEFSGKP